MAQYILYELKQPRDRKYLAIGRGQLHGQWKEQVRRCYSEHRDPYDGKAEMLQVLAPRVKGHDK